MGPSKEEGTATQRFIKGSFLSKRELRRRTECSRQEEQLRRIG